MSKTALLSTTHLTKNDPIQSDFRNFLWIVWRHLGLPDPTPIQNDVALWLQNGPRRRITMAFRGIGKSWITSAYVCWRLLCNPQIKVLVVSASKERSDQFSLFTMRLINELEILHHLIPRSDQRSSKISFDVGPARPDHSPSVKSVGITGQITGSRADLIVADDVEIPSNSATAGQRAKLAETVKEFDAVLKPGGEIVYLGTPQTEQSLYYELSARGYVIRIWPARYPTPEKQPKYGLKLAPYISTQLEASPGIVGKSTEPSRFSDEDLLERELSQGRQGFALQYQIDTSLSDAERYPLRLSDLIVHPLDTTKAPSDFVWASGPDQVWNDLPNMGLAGDRYHRPAWTSTEFAPYEGSVMFIDPSGRGKDETAYAVVKSLHGRLFLVAAGGYRSGYDEPTLEALMAVAKRHSVNLILNEPNYGGGMFTALLKGAATRHYPCRVEDADWSKSSKEARIVDTLEPVLNQHRLVVCPSVIEQDFRSSDTIEGDKAHEYRLFYQLTRITKERGALAFDDRVDALAGAVAYWQAQVARSTANADLEFRRRETEKEIEKFMGHVLWKDKEPARAWASGVLSKR
jgi:hypothetical protein